MLKYTRTLNRTRSLGLSNFYVCLAKGRCVPISNTTPKPKRSPNVRSLPALQPQPCRPQNFPHYLDGRILSRVGRKVSKWLWRPPKRALDQLGDRRRAHLHSERSLGSLWRRRGSVLSHDRLTRFKSGPLTGLLSLCNKFYILHHSRLSPLLSLPTHQSSVHQFLPHSTSPKPPELGDRKYFFYLQRSPHT